MVRVTLAPGRLAEEQADASLKASTSPTRLHEGRPFLGAVRLRSGPPRELCILDGPRRHSPSNEISVQVFPL